MKIAVLNPGSMGISVAAALKSTQQDVHWLNKGRSKATIDRTRKLNLLELNALEQLADMDGIISVCPPHAAEDVAKQVKSTGFGGLYLDANAIAPETALRVAQIIGAGYVDGGIVGPPADNPGTTRLYLSGSSRGQVKAWFESSLLEPICLDDNPGSASSLKMCYAAYTKGVSALILAVRALAKERNVEQALLDEWKLSQPELPRRSEMIARGTAPKAWRYSGEMREIANTFSASNLPDGFHHAAAEVYERMSVLKDEPDISLERVLEEILR